METSVMFIGNLRNDQDKSQLAELIFRLFKYCLNFEYIKKEDIEVKGKSKKKFAFITLRSEDDFNEAYYRLGSFESRKQERFNFFELEDPRSRLNVNRKNPPQIVKYSLQNIRNSQPVCVDERQNIPPQIRNQQSAVSVDLQVEEQYNGNVKQMQKIYRKGELLGNETRNKEFKEGGGEHFIKKHLKDTVSKYMSGFLNSSQQGTLFIGVKDDGSVVGIKCDQQKEDDIRLRIDQVIKTIKPAIFPSHYHVEFIPVYKKNGEAKANCKVLEITVDIVSMGTPEQLYEVSGEVYMRLEGSLHGPLKPTKIQEWTKQVYQKQFKRQLDVLELEAQRKSEVHQEELKRQQQVLEIEAKKKAEVHQEELKRQQQVLEIEAKKKAEVHQEEVKRQQQVLELAIEAQKKSEADQKELKRQLLEHQAKKKSTICVLM